MLPLGLKVIRVNFQSIFSTLFIILLDEFILKFNKGNPNAFNYVGVCLRLFD